MASTDNTMDTAPETVVGPSVKIQGDLNSEGNIRIEGSVAGKVKTSQSVQVGEAAKIAADITAGNAVVAGEVQGNMKIVGNLVLMSTARVAGDVSCSSLRVEDGAQFSGKCTMGGSPLATTATETKGRGRTIVHTVEPEPEEE